MHGIKPLTSLLNQLVERSQCFSVQNLLRLRGRFKRKNLHLQSVHPLDAFTRYLTPALLRPSITDDLFGVPTQKVLGRSFYRIRIATEVAP